MYASQVAPKFPGIVHIIPRRRVGRRKCLGAFAMLEGQAMICLGYTLDGLNEVYMPQGQLSALRQTSRAAERKWTYRLLRRLIEHYEVAPGVPSNSSRH